jgi:hypothetical protein
MLGILSWARLDRIVILNSLPDTITAYVASIFPTSTQLTVPACIDWCIKCSYNNDEQDGHTHDIAGPNADWPVEQMHKDCKGYLGRLLQRVREQ